MSSKEYRSYTLKISKNEIAQKIGFLSVSFNSEYIYPCFPYNQKNWAADDFDGSAIMSAIEIQSVADD